MISMYRRQTIKRSLFYKEGLAPRRNWKDIGITIGLVLLLLLAFGIVGAIDYQVASESAQEAKLNRRMK
jgi:hypothetical protein